ncbi:MAG: hypothetical protein FWG99_07820 [Treponema sp.]|nr:hypothetical protein [Treponema sp.]
MKRKNYLLLFVLILFFLSCFGNKTNTTTSVSSSSQVIKQNDLHETGDSHSNVSLSSEDLIEFLRKNERRIIERDLDVVFIEKAKFGIPGGDNWIVQLSDRSGILIYAISDDKIEKRYYLTSFNLENRSSFNIMQDIPGTRIGNSTSSFGDFNGDGIDEIFEYGFYGRAFEIIVWGYNVEKDDFIPYCTIPFRIIDSEYGPAPVEFMTYNGMYGFKVFFWQNEVAGGPGWVPDPNPKNGKWIFYTWDAEKREYVEVGEVIEE